MKFNVVTSKFVALRVFDYLQNRHMEMMPFKHLFQVVSEVAVFPQRDKGTPICMETIPSSRSCIMNVLQQLTSDFKINFLYFT